MTSGCTFLSSRVVPVAFCWTRCGRLPHLVARAWVGYVPEDRQVFPEDSVEDNLKMAAKNVRDGTAFWSLARVLRHVSALESIATSACRAALWWRAADVSDCTNFNGKSNGTNT
jgi:hypothetical protein